MEKKFANVTATVEMIVEISDARQYDDAEFKADLENTVVSHRWFNVTGTRIAYVREDTGN